MPLSNRKCIAHLLSVRHILYSALICESLPEEMDTFKQVMHCAVRGICFDCTVAFSLAGAPRFAANLHTGSSRTNAVGQIS